MKRRTFKFPPAKTGSAAELKEAAALEPPLSMVINVRAAKDQLSSLLEQAARGNEVIITSDGEPKAKLVPFRAPRRACRSRAVGGRDRARRAGWASLTLVFRR